MYLKIKIIKDKNANPERNISIGLVHGESNFHYTANMSEEDLIQLRDEIDAFLKEEDNAKTYPHVFINMSKNKPVFAGEDKESIERKIKNGEYIISPLSETELETVKKK